VQVLDYENIIVPKYQQTLGICVMDSNSETENNYAHEMYLRDNSHLEQWKAIQFNIYLFMDLLLTISGSIQFVINIERQR
jgi:hypothetical protein